MDSERWQQIDQLEATYSLGVEGELSRQLLERNLASQSVVLGQVNFSHASFPEQGYDLVRTDSLSGRQLSFSSGEELGSDIDRRGFNEII